MVLGLFDNEMDAEIALNNLSEADFNSQDISVIMEDTQAIKKIANVSGELTGLLDEAKAKKFQELGLTQTEIENIKSTLQTGGVMIVVETSIDSQSAAQEILADQKAQDIKVVNLR